MPKKEVRKSEKNNDNKLFAFLATFLSIIGFIIALITKKDNKYVMYYAKQSLVIFIIAIIAAFASAIVGWIPFLGQIISLVLNAMVVVAWVLSWIFALSGEQKRIPFVSDWAKKIDL